MSDKIDFFDDRKVGAAARRLAHCFNLSARIEPVGGNPLATAGDLFRESTGMDTIPPFNPEEIGFLRMALAETAAMRAPAGSLTLQELKDEGDLLFNLAQAMRLIREEGNPAIKPPRPDPDERHPSFPGA